MLPYNDLAAVEACFAEYGADIACVITEAAAGNMGAIAPLPGFNAGLREITARHGALLIMDEVMTGFRVSGGRLVRPRPRRRRPVHVRQGDERRPARGRVRRPRDVMSKLAPAGPVYQAGTLSGNPVAVAAGLATLRHADAGRLRHARRERAHDRGARRGVAGRGRRRAPGAVRRQPRSRCSSPRSPVTDFAAAQEAETFRYTPFFHAMLDAGVYLPPSGVRGVVRQRGDGRCRDRPHRRGTPGRGRGSRGSY